MELANRLKDPTILGGLILICVLLVAFIFGGLGGYQFPQVNVAQAAQSALAWLGGLAIMAAGGTIIVLAALRGRWFGAVLGAIGVIVGLTLVGVNVGVPAILEPLAGILNALVDVLNTILGFFGQLAGGDA